MPDLTRWSLATRLLALAVLLSATASIADDSNCAGCGCQAAKKVCRLVPEDKTITVTCWGYQDEEFCIPGPSSLECKHEESACAECDPSGKTCSVPKKFSWLSWCPGGCPQVMTKRKLVKRTVTKKVPSFKWVVEDLCADCQQAIAPIEVPKGSAIPPVPRLALESTLQDRSSMSDL